MLDSGLCKYVLISFGHNGRSSDSFARLLMDMSSDERVFGPKVFNVQEIPSPLGGTVFVGPAVAFVGGSPPPPVSKVRDDWPSVAFTRAGGREIGVKFSLKESGDAFEARSSLSPLGRKAVVLYLPPNGAPKYTLMAMLLDSGRPK